MTTNTPDYNRRYTFVRWLQLLEEYGNCCSVCLGKVCNNEKLEFAHIKPTGLNGMGRGKTIRMHDIIKNKDCYALMGQVCHRRYDSNL